MLSRLPCWQCSLSKFLFLNSDRHFAYGSFDCCLFVCDAIQAMTGTDIAARFRGAYSSLKEARKYGSVRKIVEQVTAEFAMPEVSILHAQRGDAALVKRRHSYVLGLVDLNGRQIVVLSGNGLMRIPVREASRAWRV
jgi:hypothetical protein